MLKLGEQQAQALLASTLVELRNLRMRRGVSVPLHFAFAEGGNAPEGHKAEREDRRRKEPDRGAIALEQLAGPGAAAGRPLWARRGLAGTLEG